MSDIDELITEAEKWLKRDARRVGMSQVGIREIIVGLLEALKAARAEGFGIACTCGSGAHPRRCERHPDAYDHHCRELTAQIEEVDAARAEARREALLEAVALLAERSGHIEDRSAKALHKRLGFSPVRQSSEEQVLADNLDDLASE